MSALDDIAQERQRLAERLARIDADRAKLAEQLAELEAAERVLSRFTRTRPAGRRGRRAAAAPASTAAEPRRGRRGRRAAPKAASRSLGDVTLRAVGAHQNGISAEDIRNYLADQFGMQVRPNHLGMALQRHRRAGHLEQRDSLWFSGQAGGEEAVA
jgi:hypothetical protein